jgi:hypothetical protein
MGLAKLLLRRVIDRTRNLLRTHFYRQLLNLLPRRRTHKKRNLLQFSLSLSSPIHNQHSSKKQIQQW